MNEKKNIDRLFQEKFKDFEVAPNDAVWNRINESLPQKKKKRRVIPIWWQIAGIAATVALLLTIGFSIFDSETSGNETPIIVDTEQTESPTNSNNNVKDASVDDGNDLNSVDDSQNSKLVESDNSNHTTKHESLSNPRTKTNNDFKRLTNNPKNNRKTSAVANNSKNGNQKSQKPQSLVNDNLKKRSNVASTDNDKSLNTTSKLEEDTKMKSTIKDAIVNKNTSVAENSSSEASETKSNTEITDKEEDALVKEDPKKESILEAIANNTEDIDEEEKEDEQNRWSITPNVAPVYFSSLGQGSTIHDQFSENSKSSDINMSYGISGSYAITDKLKVRAGINRVDLNYSTQNILAFNGASAQATSGLSRGNINFKNGTPVSIVSLETLDRFTAPEAFNTKISGEIDQRFGFIEVPLELEYRLLDKKFGINVIGGFSTFFLNQNEIYADIDGTSTLIGEANNINQTSFSANFGLGLDYDLSKRWNINLEPQFKYQINTFNNTFGNFRPFFVGVYTGLRFKF